LVSQVADLVGAAGMPPRRGKASPLGLGNGMLLVAAAHTLALTFGIFTAKFPCWNTG
jgi:hypothetical protein